MLATLIQLFSDERLGSFSQDPLFGHRLVVIIHFDLDRAGCNISSACCFEQRGLRWKMIDVFCQVMIQEGRARFEGMRHLATITKT